MLCKYGCGKEGAFILKNGALCCSSHYSKCSKLKERNSQGQKKSFNSANNPTHRQYWLERGYSEDEAISEVKARKKISPEYWLKRGYSIEEALSNSKKYSRETNKSYLEYWLKRGFGEESANYEMIKFKEKLASIVSNRTDEEKRRFNPLCKEYWTHRGFKDDEEIKKLIQNQQRKHFDYEKTIKKSSETKKEKWKTLTKEEKSIYNRKKFSAMYERHKKKEHSPIFINFWLKRGFTEEEAKIKVRETKFVYNNNTISSKIENQCFSELEVFLDIKFDSTHFLSFPKNNYLPDRKYKDFLFEFNGTYVHLDNRFYDETSLNPFGVSFNERKDRDDKKIKQYLIKYNVIVIWEYDFKNHKQELFNLIKNFIDENCQNRRLWESSSIQYQCGK